MIPTAEAEVASEQSRNAADSPSIPRAKKHVPELDGVRGLAILSVLLLHAFAWSMELETWSGFPRWVELATRPGWMGVDLFFVLSGFLITGILLDSADKPHYFRNFYARRALRILPLYYLFLILIAVCYRNSGSYVEVSAFYLSNMAPILGVAVLYGPLWSLSVEEHFYLLWPWLLSRLKARRIWILAAAICIIEPIFRGVAFFHGWNVYEYSWFRFDSLAAGSLLASFVRSSFYTRENLFRLGLICIGAAVLLAGAGLPFGLYTRKRLIGDSLLFTFCAVLFTGLIAVVLSGGVSRLSTLMRSRALRRCGELSYFLYIAHWLIFHGWDSWIGKYPGEIVAHLGRFGALCLRALCVYAVCFVLAELSSRYFEGPLLGLKRHFAYSQGSVAPRAAASFRPVPAAETLDTSNAFPET